MKYEKGKAINLSKNFKAKEFDCRGKGCCTETEIDKRLVELLQGIRDRFNKPVRINSGYRCKKHNKAVGGAVNSKHCFGMAADITVEGVKPLEVAQYAEGIGIKGIGLYESERDGFFVHIDTRDKKSFWYGKSEIKKESFFENNIILNWQKAAIGDGFKLENDGLWGSECENTARKAILKKRIIYKYKNLTVTVQRALGVKADGKFGNKTRAAVMVYQKKQGLKSDGIVGIKTWKRILEVE